MSQLGIVFLPLVVHSIVSVYEQDRQTSVLFML